LVAQAQFVQQHSGPLPDPETFRSYDLVVPGAAERILRMAETDAAHNRDLEQRDMRAAEREGMVARLTAAAIPIGGICAAVVLGLHGGAEWVAGILGAGSLSSPLIAALLQGRGGDKR
jgi:uncharacterized membrane protein